MSVTTATITLVSGKKYLLNKDFTEEDFTLYKQWAEDQFKLDNPGLPISLCDRAVALLICHYISVGLKGGSNKLSEKIGDFYATYAQGVLPTSFLGEYRRLISSATGEQPSRGVQHSDFQTSTAMHLSPQKIPEMDSIDTSMIPAELNYVDTGV